MIQKAKIAAITKAVQDQFVTELTAMKKSPERPHGFTKNQIADLASGHADGLRNMVTALRAQGLIVVED